MAHYAHLDPFNVVDNVIVADADFIATLPDPEKWIVTSYNTRGGVHYSPVTGLPDGGTATHKNYAGVGFIWDGVGFAEPQPFQSWTLDPSTYQWQPPNPYPTDGKQYAWFEATQSWVEVAGL